MLVNPCLCDWHKQTYMVQNEKLDVLFMYAFMGMYS